MLDWLAQRLRVSPTVAAILVALVIIQITLQLWALVDLARRDAVRGDKKWPWALLILLANLPGAIAYLAAGRVAAPVDLSGHRSGASAAGADSARRAVDTLYGPK